MLGPISRRDSVPRPCRRDSVLPGGGESIPRARWHELFRVFADRLAPSGRIGLQAITVGDRHWASSNANPDFVRRYVFPGGQVPSPGVLRADAAGAGLRILAREGLGASYARTLAEWRRRFDAAWSTIAALGFDERFKRMWQYYLSYCEGGFRSGRTDVSQIVLEAAELSPAIRAALKPMRTA